MRFLIIVAMFFVSLEVYAGGGGSLGGIYEELRHNSEDAIRDKIFEGIDSQDFFRNKKEHSDNDFFEISELSYHSKVDVRFVHYDGSNVTYSIQKGNYEVFYTDDEYRLEESQNELFESVLESYEFGGKPVSHQSFNYL